MGKHPAVIPPVHIRKRTCGPVPARQPRRALDPGRWASQRRLRNRRRADRRLHRRHTRRPHRNRSRRLRRCLGQRQHAQQFADRAVVGRLRGGPSGIGRLVRGGRAMVVPTHAGGLQVSRTARRGRRGRQVHGAVQHLRQPSPKQEDSQRERGDRTGDRHEADGVAVIPPKQEGFFDSNNNRRNNRSKATPPSRGIFTGSSHRSAGRLGVLGRIPGAGNAAPAAATVRRCDPAGDRRPLQCRPLRCPLLLLLRLLLLRLLRRTRRGWSWSGR